MPGAVTAATPSAPDAKSTHPAPPPASAPTAPQGLTPPSTNQPLPLPVVISTWSFGVAANAACFSVLKRTASDSKSAAAAVGTALDAVEAGIRVAEADREVDSVGFGGKPDRGTAPRCMCCVGY